MPRRGQAKQRKHPRRASREPRADLSEPTTERRHCIATHINPEYSRKSNRYFNTIDHLTKTKRRTLLIEQLTSQLKPHGNTCKTTHSGATNNSPDIKIRNDNVLRTITSKRNKQPRHPDRLSESIDAAKNNLGRALAGRGWLWIQQTH